MKKQQKNYQLAPYHPTHVRKINFEDMFCPEKQLLSAILKPRRKKYINYYFYKKGLEKHARQYSGHYYYVPKKQNPESLHQLKPNKYHETEEDNKTVCEHES